MKNKKIIAIALCIGLFVPSLTGIVTIYAKSEASKKEEALTTKAPAQNITDLEPELNNQIITQSTYKSADSDSDSIVLYRGTKSSLSPDIFNFDQNDIEELIESGYSIQDIFEADEIGNNIIIDPVELLQRKKETNKSLEQIKDDVLKERKEKNFKDLKKKYEKEFKILNEESLDDDEILNLLAYIDVNGLQLTDNLIKEYKNKGKEIFKEAKEDKKISKEIQKKYQLTDKEAEVLTEDIIIGLETLSKQINTPVKDLIKSYIENIKK